MGLVKQILLTRKEKSNKLKPCPDCNGHGKMRILRGDQNCTYRKIYDYVFIQCEDCYLCTKAVLFDNEKELEYAKKESIKRWNQRG